MTKILIVEDDPAIALGLEDDLKLEGYEVEVAPDGESALRRARDGGFDLLLLDIMLPGKDGFQVCRELRRGGISVPIVMLTARAQPAEKVLGLEMGADDYVTKPFSHIELLARMNAVLRRAHPVSDDNPPPFESGGVKVDFAGREVWVKGQKVRLTPIEFAILSQLAKNAGKVVTHKDLLTNVWGAEYTDAVNYLKVHMQRLRRKLAVDAEDPSPILTEWKVGYKLSLSPGEAELDQPASGPDTQ